MKNKILIFALIFSAPSWAQVVVGRSLFAIEQTYKIALMNNLSVGLLHHLKTGEAVNHAALAEWSDWKHGQEMPETVMAYKDSNEFQINRVREAWRQQVKDRVEFLRDSRAYMFPVKADWGKFNLDRSQYDFQNFKLTHQRGRESYYCAGAFDTTKYESRTSCLTTDDVRRQAQLKYFPMSDNDFAEELQRDAGLNIDVYAIAIESGTYKPAVRGRERVAENILTSRNFIIAGEQPVRIVGLLLVSRIDGVVLAVSRPGSPAASNAPWKLSASLGLQLEKRASAEGEEDDGSNLGSLGGMAGNWAFVGRGGEATLYMNISKVRRSGVTVTVPMALVTSGLEGTPSVHDARLDCAQRTYSLTADGRISTAPTSSPPLSGATSQSGHPRHQRQSPLERALALACNAASH